MCWLWISGCKQTLSLQNSRKKAGGMAGEDRGEGGSRRRLELGAKARGGTNPLSNTLTSPIEQKRIISQTLPYPQGGLSLLPTARYLLPLSPSPWHHVAHVLSLLAGTMTQSHPHPL